MLNLFRSSTSQAKLKLDILSKNEFYSDFAIKSTESDLESALFIVLQTDLMAISKFVLENFELIVDKPFAHEFITDFENLSKAKQSDDFDYVKIYFDKIKSFSLFKIKQARLLFLCPSDDDTSPETFSYVRSAGADQNVLNRYIQVGCDIRRARSSEFTHINNLLRDGPNDLWVKRQIQKIDEDVESDRLFVVFAAPSFSGKTQMAFSIDTKRPLYFVLAVGEDQPIYSHFESLSARLRNYATLDALKVQNTEQQSTSGQGYLSSTKLDTSTPFLTIGFLWALMEESEDKFTEPDIPPTVENWMLFYADRTINGRQTLQFYPKSIDDCKGEAEKLNRFIAKYCVFLDEFEAKDYAVFIRNICKRLGILCCLASTNSRVANLTGHSSQTRSERVLLWCVVITKLPMMSRRYFANSHNLEGLVGSFFNDRRRQLQESEETDLRNLFRYIIDDQLESLRPGIASVVASFVVTFFQKSNISSRNIANSLLEHVITSLSSYVFNRKTRITMRPTGSSAQVALLSSEVFHAVYDYHLDRELIKPDFLNDHLYQLINPLPDDRSNMFLLFTSSNLESADTIFFYKNRNVEPFAFRTCFLAQEEILKLACYVINLPRSTTSAINLSTIKFQNSEIVSVPNPRDLYRCGNNLETASMFSFIESSHPKYGFIPIFGGMHGTIFLKKLLKNFSLQTSNIDIDFRSTKYLLNFLKNVRVPFLNTSNMEPSEITHSILGVSSFTRLPRNNEIDAFFSIFYKNVECTAVVECKNTLDPVSIPEYCEIMDKARKVYKNAKIHFLLCHQMIDPEYTTDSLTVLGDRASNRNYNIYRFQYYPLLGKVKAIPFDQSYVSHKKPEMIFIIIETSKTVQL